MFAKYYAEFYETLNQDKSYKKEIEFVYQWGNKPRWICDIGCGSGAYWKFYPKSTNIFGIEKSEAMIGNNPKIIRSDIQKYKHNGRVDLVTALFDVINYIPKHNWWRNIPLNPGGLFIFDIWDKEKVDKEGFRITEKKVGDVSRKIIPSGYDGKSVNLEITIGAKEVVFMEEHKMYVWSDEDIANFCGKDFTIVDTKSTEKWQKWYKLRKE